MTIDLDQIMFQSTTVGEVWKEGRKWCVREPYSVIRVGTKRLAQTLAQEAVDWQRRQEAVQEYLGRRDRTRHPEGRIDKASRWFPSDSEYQGCCQGIRTPSRSWPWSLMVHCRTITPIARLYKVEEDDLRREARRRAA